MSIYKQAWDKLEERLLNAWGEPIRPSLILDVMRQILEQAREEAEEIRKKLAKKL